MHRSFLFHLGRERAISIEEIRSILEQNNTVFSVSSSTGVFFVVETKGSIDCLELMDRLGGTILIGEAISRIESTEKTIAEFLERITPEGKIQFSLSGDATIRQGLEIKKMLKQIGRSARFLEFKNTATILHNGLVERQSHFTLTQGQIFVTRAIQPIEEFGERDYGRPAFDNKSGMLPPKLARIMINLAGINPKNAVLLDPFCGSGTVLMEAMTLGFKKIIGSDLSQKAVDDTKKNLEWLEQKNTDIQKQHITWMTFLSDARKMETHVKPHSVDCIVTEPYLGKPLRGNESEDILKKQKQELEKLYSETLVSLARVLKPDGVIVFIVPRFRFGEMWITIDLRDAIKKAGLAVRPFTETTPLLYWRQDQRVGREIWRVEKDHSQAPKSRPTA